MKAKLVAVLISLIVCTLPTHAEDVTKKHLTGSISTAPHKINLNAADVKVLTGSFKGIGKKRAEAIVAYRKEHNGFKSIDELAQIRGFGQRFIATNRDKLNELFSCG